MFQLDLDFLGQQFQRLRGPRGRTVVSPLAWKHGLLVYLVRPARARRYLLRLQADGSARLVIPRRGSQAEGLRFLERSEPWLLEQLARWRKRSEARLPLREGTRFLFRGEWVALAVERLEGGLCLRFADEAVPVAGEVEDYRAVVLGHLRRMAERELPRRTRELAEVHGIAIARVTVRAQKTRWGSCSARGTISLNWRLVQAPAFVSDYLIVHELMHRREMNHSRRYWKLVEEALPDYRVAERWLKGVRLDEGLAAVGG